MATQETATQHYGLWIDGDTREARDERVFSRDDPYARRIAGEYANADEADAEVAIESARAAFDSGVWSLSSARVRHDVLRRAGELLDARSAAVAERMVVESGKPITLALAEVGAAVRCFDYYAGAVLAIEGSAISDRTPGAFGLVLREPVGVAAIIPAWNFPLLGVVNKLAPALAAGCTAVAKPSHLCTGPTVMLAQILSEAGLPDGVFNVVPSDLERGAVVGQALAGSLAIDKVSFTGSTASGRAVMRAAASNTKRISLELGGKSANIVFDDAPFDQAVGTAINAFCFNSGQQCSAGSRLLVQRGIHERFVDALIAEAGQQVIGDPALAQTTMGPLVSEQQLDRVLGYIGVGSEEGVLVAGGGPPADAGEDTLFVEPTIFDQVDNASRIAQEEVFGPVLAVIPFETEQEAIELANASDYGLAGAVWSTSLDRALRVTRAMRTGKVFVNAYNTAGIEDMPHGGYKGSGFGREFGEEGLDEYHELKTVQIKLAS